MDVTGARRERRLREERRAVSGAHAWPRAPGAAARRRQPEGGRKGAAAAATQLPRSCACAFAYRHIDHAPVRLACSARVDYPNGDTYEGGFNELKQRHGRGVYTWSSRPGAHPWVPEEGTGESVIRVVPWCVRVRRRRRRRVCMVRTWEAHWCMVRTWEAHCASCPPNCPPPPLPPSPFSGVVGPAPRRAVRGRVRGGPQAGRRQVDPAQRRLVPRRVECARACRRRRPRSTSRLLARDRQGGSRALS